MFGFFGQRNKKCYPSTECFSFLSDTKIIHSSCASYVGYIGGQQEVFVGPGCILGNIVHEILHALGFHHEHTRTDRGQYITVLSHNIMNGNVKNLSF